MVGIRPRLTGPDHVCHGGLTSGVVFDGAAPPHPPLHLPVSVALWPRGHFALMLIFLIGVAKEQMSPSKKFRLALLDNTVWVRYAIFSQA